MTYALPIAFLERDFAGPCEFPTFLEQPKLYRMRSFFLAVFGAMVLAASAQAGTLSVPPAATAGLEALYAGDQDAAIEIFQKIQREQPEHPLGYILEVEARWWTIYCSSAEFKYGMTDAWRRTKRAEDQPYFDLAQKANTLAEAQLRNAETAEMHFYAGMGQALIARLYSLRGENRAAARLGVPARAHFIRALALDPGLADADLGIGLYNYYVDTLSGLAKILRFFMGIPGGSKRDGVKQLEHAVASGALTQAEARFQLAKNLRNYDQDYHRALAVIEPLMEQYPSNPFFQLLQGDLYAKLSRKEEAALCFRVAAALPVRDPQCRQRIQELTRAALSALGPSFVP